MDVRQFRYGDDNLSYLVHDRGEAFVCDGGAVAEILAFLRQQGLTLTAIANTHDHPDHTPGNAALRQATGAPLIAHRSLAEGHRIPLGNGGIGLLKTPGHSEDSVCYLAGRALLSGDTLFNGTIGNCFTGDLRGFYTSIRKLMALPPETLIYAGHDYVLDALAFARRLEPANAALDVFRNAYDPGHVRSTLADELRINPYLRFNEASILSLLWQKKLPCGTEWERWQSLMTIP